MARHGAPKVHREGDNPWDKKGGRWMPQCLDAPKKGKTQGGNQGQTNQKGECNVKN